jgi:hypothetical protein
MNAVCGVVLGLVGSGALARPGFPVPRGTESMAEYSARWDAWFEETRAEHACPEVLRILGEYERLRPDVTFVPRAEGQGTAEERRATVEFVERHPALLAEIRAAVLGPVLGASVEGTDGPYHRAHRERVYGRAEDRPTERPRFPWEILLPSLGDLRGLSVLLMVDAGLAAREGEFARVEADLRQARRMIGLMQEPPTTIGVGITADLKAALARTVLSMDLATMPDATLAALGEVLDVGSVHRADAYGFEAWSTVGMLRWVYDDEGGEGLMTTAAVQRWYEVHSMIAGNDTNQAAFVGRAFGAGPLGEQLEAAARLGDAVRAELGVPRHALERSEVQAVFDGLDERRLRPARDFAPMGHPASVYLRTTNHEMLPPAARVRLALERHHRRHGVYPATLDGLDADLRVEAVDLHTGGALIYRLGEGGPVVYSAGPDRDDDGGAKVAEMDGWLSLEQWREAAGDAEIDGDVVLVGGE